MFIRLLGIGLAAALLAVSAPVLAAAPAPDEIVFASGFVLKATTPDNDCVGSFDMSQSILLVEAETGCDPVLAEATGLCLVPAASAPLDRIAGVLDPQQDASCVSIRPSPPG